MKYKHLTLRQLYVFSLMKWERIQKRLEEEYYFDETEGKLDETELQMDILYECAFCFDAKGLEGLNCKSCRIDHNICDESIQCTEMDAKIVNWVIQQLKEKYYELEKECEKPR